MGNMLVKTLAEFPCSSRSPGPWALLLRLLQSKHPSQQVRLKVYCRGWCRHKAMIGLIVGHRQRMTAAS